jgi:CHAD domain-containing protein
MATADPLSNGAHARALIEGHGRRLSQLQREVLRDGDREPLHQVRVSLRRLRTVLSLFGPALVLPRGVRAARIASLARCTGATRDLDVLGERLQGQLLPRLDPADHQALRPLLRRLARRRQRAFHTAQEALSSPRTERLLRKIDRWQRRPQFTALGQEPLADWQVEWHRPLSAALFLHPGWWAGQPRDPELHALRKRIKGVRYSLEALGEPLEGSRHDWIAALKQAQGVLGELHDLQVLEALLHEESAAVPRSARRGLQAELERQRAIEWARWRELSGRLLRPECRAALSSLSPLPPWPAAPGPEAAGS